MGFDEYYKQYLIGKGLDVKHIKVGEMIKYPKFEIYYINSSNKLCGHFEERRNILKLQKVYHRNEVIETILSND